MDHDVWLDALALGGCLDGDQDTSTYSRFVSRLGDHDFGEHRSVFFVPSHQVRCFFSDGQENTSLQR
jgi:hypothetical protein